MSGKQKKSDFWGTLGALVFLAAVLWFGYMIYFGGK